MADIKSITVAEFFSDVHAEKLLAEYAAECSLAGLPPYDPDLAIYQALEQSGATELFGAYNHGELVGFAMALAVRNPHYSRVIATLESYFVAQDARKSGAGLALLAAARGWARRCQAIALFVSAPAGGQLAKVLARHPAYRESNQVFMEVLL